MAYNPETILGIVKSRLNRLPDDKSLDAYLAARIQGADEKLLDEGIKLNAESMHDSVFLSDIVVWGYLNRDKVTDRPEWLKFDKKSRWLQQTHKGAIP